jgi:hypothetical protein
MPVRSRADLPDTPLSTSMAVSKNARGAGKERRSGGANVALYDVEPVGEGSVERKGIASYTLEARSVLGGAVKIRWGLEDGRWYVLSASPSR